MNLLDKVFPPHHGKEKLEEKPGESGQLYVGEECEMTYGQAQARTSGADGAFGDQKALGSVRGERDQKAGQCECECH